MQIHLSGSQQKEILLKLFHDSKSIYCSRLSNMAKIAVHGANKKARSVAVIATKFSFYIKCDQENNH